MERYELATLTTTIGAAPKISDAIRDFCTGSDAKGHFLGAWATDLGNLNRVYVLRGFDDGHQAAAERQRTQLSANPFGAGEVLTALSLDTLKPFAHVPPVQPGQFGPIYEIRSYILKIGGLAPTLEGWAEALPPRLEVSPIIIAGYTIDGPQRITHIWPYASLAARSELRAEAVKRGIWPPKSASWLTSTMESNIALPLESSPLK